MTILKKRRIVIQLLHKASFSSNKVTGIRKVICKPSDHVKNDTILYTNSFADVNEDIDIILTNSEEIFRVFNSTINILYFNRDSLNIEENSLVRIEQDLVYFTFLPSSNSHALFVTKRCNHYCLMCSEPPSKINDDYLIDENMKIIELLDKRLEVIGITGGEPTILGKAFIKIVKKIREELPDTKIRLLTNGRSFTNKSFCQELSLIAKEHLISEIPLYNTNYIKHDYIVQSKGAFFETIEGFYNCAKYGLSTEVRIVITKQNYHDLEKLIYYIYKNMPFVEHIALMGLEYIGFALLNFNEIHISPLEYKQELVSAILLAKRYRLAISIYNLPLCLVDTKVQCYTKKSISDWKNDFADCCYNCDERYNCAGMFTSTKPYFTDLLTPIKLTNL